jgi:cytoskeletal protein RodZ
MRAGPSSDSPETRRRANALLRLLTRSVVLVATGATIAIGVVVAKEHPGASASSNPVPSQAPITSTPSTSTTTTSPPITTPTSSDPGSASTYQAPTTTTSPPTTTTLPPTTTTTPPVVTSGATSRR